MFYKVLGMAVWKGAKLVLRRKYGPTYTPKPVLAGLVILLVGGLAAVLLRRDDSA